MGEEQRNHCWKARLGACSVNSPPEPCKGQDGQSGGGVGLGMLRERTDKGLRPDWEGPAREFGVPLRILSRALIRGMTASGGDGGGGPRSRDTG